MFFQVPPPYAEPMRMNRLAKSCLYALALLAAGEAFALGGATVMVGQRSADFHRFTGGRGYEIASGTDFTVEAYTDPFQGLPLGLGLFYSTQSYNVSGDDHLFDEASVSELGPVMEVWTTRLNEKYRGFARYAHTLIGSFEGKMTADRTMETGGGTTAYDAGSKWQAELSGPHVSVGILIGNEDAGAGLALDLGFQHSRVKKIEAYGEDRTAAYAPYMKTDSDFQSTALLITVQARH